jgi:hypothetical protein
MGNKKGGYARYTFAFAADIQNLADEKHIRVLNFNTTERNSSSGVYDVLTVNFKIPRPDKTEKKAKTVPNSETKSEVNENEI